MDGAQILEGLRRELQEENARCIDPDIGPRLDYAKWGDGFRVWAFGIDVPFTALARDPVARELVSLTIDSPDLGANGTCNWDLTEFADSDVVYPMLRHLRIARNAPDRHNRCIIARTYDEDGVLGRIAKKAPQLESLETPSAPSANFFEAELKSLMHLRVDAGFDTNNFIRMLAQASFPPKLCGLEWGDYAERYMEDWRSKTTPFADMAALVGCEGFGQIKAFSLRNTAYANDELKQLKALRPGLSIRVVTSAHAYV